MMRAIEQKMSMRATVGADIVSIIVAALCTNQQRMSKRTALPDKEDIEKHVAALIARKRADMHRDVDERMDRGAKEWPAEVLKIFSLYEAARGKPPVLRERPNAVRFTIDKSTPREVVVVFRTMLGAEYEIVDKVYEDSCLDDDGPYGYSSWRAITVEHAL